MPLLPAGTITVIVLSSTWVNLAAPPGPKETILTHPGSPKCSPAIVTLSPVLPSSGVTFLILGVAPEQLELSDDDVATLLEEALEVGDPLGLARDRFRMAVLRRFYERYGELFGPRALRSFDELDGSIVSSTVPQLEPEWTSMASRYLGHEMLVVGPGIKTGLAIRYDNPREIGADRLVNAVALRDRLGQLAPGRRELIDEAGRPPRVRTRQDESVPLELTQALSEDVGRDARQLLLEITEALRSLEQRCHEQECPSIPHPGKRLRERRVRGLVGLSGVGLGSGRVSPEPTRVPRWRSRSVQYVTSRPSDSASEISGNSLPR